MHFLVWNNLKTIKNAFYFTLKALFVLKIFIFLSQLSGHVEKRKDKVNFKIYDVTAYETIVIHILRYISRCKDNQTAIFGQLIEYNMINIFLEKTYTNCGGETSSRSFSKKSNYAYLRINSLKFYTVYFYCMPNWGLSSGLLCFIFLIKLFFLHAQKVKTKI